MPTLDQTYLLCDVAWNHLKARTYIRQREAVPGEKGINFFGTMWDVVAVVDPNPITEEQLRHQYYGY